MISFLIVLVEPGEKMAEESTIKCPHCFSDIDARATVCPVCKRDIKPVQKAKSGGNPLIKALAAVALVVICCIGAFAIALPFLANISPNGSTASATTAALPSATNEPAPPLDEILSSYREMTDAQWNAYGESLVGKRANEWAGQITEVNEGEVFGGFTVYVQVEGANFGEYIFIDVSEDVAMALRKDQRIVFSGNITAASNAAGLGIRLNNAEIEEAETSR